MQGSYCLDLKKYLRNISWLSTYKPTFRFKKYFRNMAERLELKTRNPEQKLREIIAHRDQKN